jgi:Zn-dependent M28 family amino/carboxypeptidase
MPTNTVRIVTRKAWIRIASLVLLLWITLLYMSRCPHPVTSPEANMTTIENLAAQLRIHVQKLAGDIGQRNIPHFDGLREAADYIEQTWQEQGYQVRRQTYRVGTVEVANVEVTLTGTRRSDEIVLIGAHYDSVEGSPGANDNATGVAALLELSRLLSSTAMDRTVRFVAFVNEEPPCFQTPAMGSRVYAVEARQRGDNIHVMISLETMGFYSDRPGSQQYPAFFRWMYPSTGNFIAFVSDLNSRSRMREAVAAFRQHSDFPAECCATFAGIPGIDWSDHGSFWKEGYRAFMVTDTAPYRYPHYHQLEDTPDKVDYKSLARVTAGLQSVIESLAR